MAMLVLVLVSGLLVAGCNKNDDTSDFKFKADNGKVTITGYTGTATDVRIPATIKGMPVTAIGSGAFEERDDLRSIQLPNNLISIGVFAFGRCTGLTEITIPPHVQAIGGFAFAWCDNITKITITNPPVLMYIAINAFALCQNLVSITVPHRSAVVREGSFSSLPKLDPAIKKELEARFGGAVFSEGEGE
jgi:hypothetical protein